MRVLHSSAIMTRIGSSPEARRKRGHEQEHRSGCCGSHVCRVGGIGGACIPIGPRRCDAGHDYRLRRTRGLRIRVESRRSRSEAYVGLEYVEGLNANPTRVGERATGGHKWNAQRERIGPCSRCPDGRPAGQQRRRQHLEGFDANSGRRSHDHGILARRRRGRFRAAPRACRGGERVD
jgi:hypothetical protein